ncbi:MAG: hypothetical protein WA691_00270 [Thermoplasmata archaeon]
MADVRAPPDFVVDWWLEYTPEDASVAQGAGQEAVRIDDRTVRLSTRSEVGGRVRSTVGTVVRTGATTWRMTAHVFSGDSAVSTLQTAYSVAATVDGSRVEANFEIRGLTLTWRVALSTARFFLRRDRVRSLERCARAIEQEFARPARGRAVGAPGSPPESTIAPPA